MRNDKFLKSVINKKQVDYLYHLGLNSESSELKKMKNIKAVIMAGSRDRIKRISSQYKGKSFEFKKNERFYAKYVKDTLFISHGMGMPSASICLQEILKMIYYIKKGKMREVRDVFICRIGTSGGFNVPAGSLVLSDRALMVDMLPYRTRRLFSESISYNSTFPEKTIKNIIKANPDIKFEIGTTLSCDDFYLEQLREDGAIINVSKDEKEKIFKNYVNNNVKNMEMEAAMIASICNEFGHKNFATLCCTLLDRFKKDQVTSSPEELTQFSMNAEKVILNYLKTI